jgi:hypothetical protein
MNPLLPVKSFLRISKQNMSDLTRQKILSIHPPEEIDIEGYRPKVSYKINEMITIDFISKSGGINIYKRVLHAPTLTLFVIQVI